MRTKLTISKPVAPEDLRPDQYIVVTHQTVELIPFCFEPEPWKKPEVTRISLLPGCDAGVPMRILEVCIPFVLVEQVDGRHRAVDVRRVRLAVVSDRYGRRAFKKLRAPRPDPDGCL